MRFRHVPPAGAPIRPGDLARWMAALLPGSDPVVSLRRAVAERVGAADVHLTSTGRAGMTVILRALAKLAPADRDEVVVPSYTCYSVAASVLRAGLTPRVVDIEPDTLDYDHDGLDRADTRRVMAIVATNLFGLPNDMPRLSAWAASRGIYLVDDAAQAFGATVAGRPSGTWGDAGLFSFDKGKNVSAINGGVVVSMSDRVAGAVSDEMRTVPAPSSPAIAIELLKLGAYSLLLHPRTYWIPNGIPQLGLGQTVYTTDFPIQTCHRPFAALGLTMLARLDEFTRMRRDNAARLLAGLRDVQGLDFVRPLESASPVYLRLPILVAGRERRRRMLSALNQAGIGATASYPASLVDVPGLQPRLLGSVPAHSGGRLVAERIVTLPTHPYVLGRDVKQIIAVVAHVAAEPVERPTEVELSASRQRASE